MQLLTEALKVTFTVVVCSHQLSNFMNFFNIFHLQDFLLTLSNRLEIGQQVLKDTEELKLTQKIQTGIHGNFSAGFRLKC